MVSFFLINQGKEKSRVGSDRKEKIRERKGERMVEEHKAAQTWRKQARVMRAFDVLCDVCRRHNKPAGLS